MDATNTHSMRNHLDVRKNTSVRHLNYPYYVDATNTHSMRNHLDVRQNTCVRHLNHPIMWMKQTPTQYTHNTQHTTHT